MLTQVCTIGSYLIMYGSNLVQIDAEAILKWVSKSPRNLEGSSGDLPPMDMIEVSVEL